MIPDLPEGVSDEDTIDFYSKLWGNLSDQSSVHMHWWTHRQNPSVCWICDLFNLTSKILEMYDKNISKSSVDMETSSSSEDDSDSEIEVNNNEPEYELADDADYFAEEEVAR